MQPASAIDVQIVGRYALYGEIAAGGMATVHFGRLLGPVGFSRPVAIKRLHPQLARDEAVRAMFIDEARLVSRIRHPNVVPTLDVVEADGQLLLVMEYVHGESLATLARTMRARRAPVPVRIALAILANVLHGLHAAHEAKTETGEPLAIVHRDVSPHNVLVGADGVARVLDFGIARATVRIEETQEGILKGKLAYMAPEQFDGEPATRQSDVYSAGVVLWELLAGRRLFVKGDDGVMLEKILHGAIDSPSALNSEVPRAVDAIVMRALDRDPERRFATARDMALALEAAVPPATATEVGDWVELVAAATLAQRAAKLEELERTSSRMRLSHPPHSDRGRAAERASSTPPNVQPSTSPFAVSAGPPRGSVASPIPEIDLELPLLGPRGRAATIAAVVAAVVAVIGSVAVIRHDTPPLEQVNAGASALPAAPLVSAAPPPAATVDVESLHPPLVASSASAPASEAKNEDAAAPKHAVIARPSHAHAAASAGRSDPSADGGLRAPLLINDEF